MSSRKRVLYSAPHLWNVFAVDDGLVFEQGTYDASPVLWHVDLGAQSRRLGMMRELARLPVGRPRGVLQGVEDGRLICLEGNGTLSAISIRDGRRTAIRLLQPTPATVAITPECVVWASSESRFLDGGDQFGVGEVWRWWRGSESVERLGEHPAFRPTLAVARTAAFGARAMTAPIYLAANQDLGLIEAELRWIGHEDQPLQEIACGSDSVFYTTSDRVMRREYATGLTSQVRRVSIPMGLAVHDRKLVLTRNSVIEQRVRVETSAVIVVDLITDAGLVVAENLGRPGSVTAGASGIAVVDGSIDYGGIDRLVWIPWDETAVADLPPAEPELDDEIWQSPFNINWWHPQGHGGYFQLDRSGAWRIHGPQGSSGQLDAAALREVAARLEAWRTEWREVAGGYLDLAANRGWLVGWGLDAWFRSAYESAAPPARAVAAARDIVIGFCPAFASVVASMP